MKSKRLSIGLLFALWIMSVAGFSQDSYSKFSFSGYKVVIQYDDDFRIDIKDKVETQKKVDNNGVYSLSILDQKGRVPKDTVYVYTNSLSYLHLHNSELVMDATFPADSLEVEFSVGWGTLNVSADFLSINAGGGSRVFAKGRASFVEYVVGASSNVDAKSLIVKEVEVDVMGHSSLTINAEMVRKKSVKNGTLKNIFNK